ncbi:tRNA pseudouridine(38-40) synthase TruA [Hyphomonas sp. FCG-A18]|uniref:tRNA pseudouridine(38-40) synthase TruA n=1 Tax=Hyphomonas sp. FCG-A18 TaxID=3080019 RepID=UPI002B2D081E|nr:tRNA pseudouridine(38-40) synthase TruA [Hyphomonas sp. FCG-A18]
MQRYKLTIEYDGEPYYGWQRQESHPSVQEALETAASKLDGAPVTVQGAGRTDRGVHATGQVAHMDLTKPRPIEKVADALNAHLRPHRVAVLKAEEVDAEFHARFHAIKRAYRYVIINRRAALTFDRGQAWRIPYKLDHEAMHRAAQTLIGIHDFSTFRHADCQAKSPVKTLDRLDVARYGEGIEVTVEARSFLHSQVRSFVGSLVEVGRGSQSEDWIAEILDARDRKACGPVAPPDGLFLERVEYDA